MRDYDPTTGRYLQGDPLGLVDGASVYGYVAHNPVNYIDPMGLEWIFLGPLPYIDSPYWTLDPTYQLPGGYRWNSICTDAQIVYHTDKRNHWHYYPNGEVSGGRSASKYRYTDPNTGDDHLYPPSWVEVCDCSSGGGGGLMLIVPGVMLGIGNDYRDGVGEQGAIPNY